MKSNITFGKIALITVIVIGLMIGLSSFGTVPPGETGVVTSLGAVQFGQAKHEGLYTITPFIDRVHIIDTKPHKISLENAEAVTLDRQEVHTSVTLVVQIDPSQAEKVYDQYRDTLIEAVVMPKFQEAVKTVTARYDAQTQVRNRGMVQAEMLAYVQHELNNKGVIVGPGALSIINFAYNNDYQKAIEDTAVAQQNLVKAEAELKVNQIQAQQKVAQARGEAESQALLAKTISDKSLQYEFYKHWDGHLPTVVGGSNIMSISSLMKH